MSILNNRLYSPELNGDHPITVVPALDVADDNPLTISATKPFDPLRTNEFRGDESRVGISTWNATDAYDISWPPQRGAKFYRVYGSMSPVNSTNLLQDEIADTTYRFFVPYVTELVCFYFFVAWVGADGKETYISKDPASLMATADKAAFATNPFPKSVLFPGGETLNKELGKAMEFIRASNAFQLGVGFETFSLYLRRHASDKPWGMRCSCVSKRDDMDDDMDYDGVERCRLCFGVGIAGGFLPKITVPLRYHDAGVEQRYQRTKSGFVILHLPNCWGLPTPVVRTGDLVVRQGDGKRFLVTATSQGGSARGVHLHIEFDLAELDKMSPLFWVTDATISDSIRRAALPSHLAAGYKIFN